MTASVAVHAQETVRQDPAIQERPQLAFDEAGDRSLAPALAVEKSLEVTGDDTVQDGFFGTTWLVAGRAD